MMRRLMRGESPSGVASCLISECCSFPLKSAHADDVVGAGQIISVAYLSYPPV